MKKWMKLVIVVAALSMLFVMGCKDDSGDPDVSAFETLTAYMDANGMTTTDLLAGWIIAPDSLIQVMGDNYIMDIRAGDYYGAGTLVPNDTIDYYDGHIEGAVLSSLGAIVDDANAANPVNPIVVVCYTGQAAGHAVMALRLSGYTDAKVLKWGMSGWNDDFDKWTGNCAQLNHANWVTASIADPQIFDYPDWEANSEDGAAILAERVAYMLEGGFKGVPALSTDTVNGALEVPTDYFINNYWSADDVAQYGHIIGAYRINPLVLENLDPDGTVVTYCWSGQTSSMLTALLTILGYDAKSLTFGVNSIIYDDLTDGPKKWSASLDNPYIVGP